MCPMSVMHTRCVRAAPHACASLPADLEQTRVWVMQPAIPGRLCATCLPCMAPAHSALHLFPLPQQSAERRFCAHAP